MPAAFWYAVHYRAEGVCKTPFRSGNQENDPESILRTRDGGRFYRGPLWPAPCGNGWRKIFPTKQSPCLEAVKTAAALWCQI